MLYATQVHPHDVRDEGAEQVVERIAAVGIRVIAAETGTLEERHPYPQGDLPHNPRHRVVITRVNLEVPLERAEFDGLAIRPRILPAVDNWFAELQAAGQKRGIQVIPWIKGLNGSFEGDVESIAVRTIDGDVVPGWLCPSHPDSAAFLSRLVVSIVKQYPSPAVLLDRVRYPDWSGATVDPKRLLTCLCATCKRRMEEADIDVPRLEAALRTWFAALSGTAVTERTVILTADSLIDRWLRFRQERITELVKHTRTALAQEGLGHVKLWLNLWPPSFAWLLGQDYRSLGPLCDGAKHFPYHRLGGGADLAGLVRALVASQGAPQEEHIFQRLRQLIGLADISFEQFAQHGLPVDFVATETAKAKEAFGATPIFTGVQIWNVPTSDIVEAVHTARETHADGFFFYCYGWATLDALDTVGRLILQNDM